VQAVSGRVGGGDLDAGESGGGEQVLVFGPGEGSGQASNVVFSFSALRGAGGVVGDDVDMTVGQSRRPATASGLPQPRLARSAPSGAAVSPA
jgi:hypothetical protein